MGQLKLRKLLSRREVLSLVEGIIQVSSSPAYLWDLNHRLLLGELPTPTEGIEPIEVMGEVIGYGAGGAAARLVIDLLKYLGSRELDNKTMAAELLERHREIAFLYKVSEKLTANLKLQEVANVLMFEQIKFMGATSGSVMLLNDESGKLEIIAASGQENQDKLSFAIGEGVAGTVAATGEGMIINDAHSDPRYVAGSNRLKSMICVPLKSKDKVIGVINLSNDSPTTYTSADLKLLQALSSQAASVIENTLLHENQLRESRREALLFRLMSQIRESLNLEQILEVAVLVVRNLLEVDICAFAWQRNPNIWEVVQETRQPEMPSCLGPHIAVKYWPVFHPALSILVVKDRLNHPQDAATAVIQSLGWRSLLALPIPTPNRDWGVLLCGQVHQPRFWKESDIEALTTVAHQLEIAINQAELYKQAQDSANQAQAHAQELEETLAQLQQAQTQLIQTDKMSGLGQMVAGIAHEVNNPVNFISGNLTHAQAYIEDLLRLVQLYQKHYPQGVPEIQAEIRAIDLSFLAEDLPKMIDSMQMGISRIQQIVASLRNFSRMDEAEMKWVNLHEGLDSTLMILHHRLKPGRGYELGIEVIKRYGLLPLVKCYPGLINQVFMNLLSNAIDAVENRPDPRRIQIETIALEAAVEIHGTTLADPSVLVRIRDNGCGIAPQVQQKLFQAFFTTKPVGKGTGLGLSISHQIVVEKHQGLMGYTSQPDEGTEFWIRLPCRQTSEAG